MLKSMCTEGLIAGRKDGRATRYTITTLGRQVAVEETHAMHDAWMAKVHEGMALANEAFDLPDHMVLYQHMDVIAPILQAVTDLLQAGVDPDPVRLALQPAIERMQAMMPPQAKVKDGQTGDDDGR